jgi:hypothetical protein
MDNSSDDKLATIANLNNEFFYKHFTEDCSDSDSKDDSDLMVVVGKHRPQGKLGLHA